MKIDKFESYNSEIFLKDYGQKYPISELKEGDEVLYRGSAYTVVKPDSYAVELISKQNNKCLVNQSMFTEFGAIRKS
jgi:hypothetical protein